MATISNYVVNTQNLKRTYTLGKVKVHAVRGIDLQVEKGKIVSLVGPSGCGKTTMLNMIGTIDTPTEGSIMINDKDINTMTDNALTHFRGNNIGFIFQNFNLIPVLNVLENIAYPLVLLGHTSKKEIAEKAEYIIEAVGLSEFVYHKPKELSGGQRQRVAIARALIIDPVLVIADEPTANLDTVSTFKIMDLMKQLQQTLHTTFLFATHDPRFFDYMDTIYQLEDGIVKDIQNLKEGA